MEEISNWKDHKVFEEVVDEGQNTVSVRWVTTKKNKDDEPVYKARLFVRGFEELRKMKLETILPPVAKKTLDIFYH